MNQLINLNPAVDLAAKEHSAAAATQFYHEGHEVLNKRTWPAFLRALRVLRGEKAFSENSAERCEWRILNVKDRGFRLSTYPIILWFCKQNGSSGR